MQKLQFYWRFNPQTYSKCTLSSWQKLGLEFYFNAMQERFGLPSDILISFYLTNSKTDSSAGDI